MVVGPAVVLVATAVTFSCPVALGWGLFRLVAAAERVEQLFVDRDAEQ